MREKSKLRRIGSNPALPTRLTDLSNPPGKSFRWRRMMTAWRERLHLIFHPYKKVQESTLAEIASIEARVRKELYP
jgi:hypothetical protein